MRIKVTNPFFYNGVALEMDQEIEVSRLFGIDMISNGKAIEIKSEPPKEEPMAEKAPEEKRMGPEKKGHPIK